MYIVYISTNLPDLTLIRRFDPILTSDIWLINVTFVINWVFYDFSLFLPTQRPPTTKIFTWKWSQDSCGSFKTQIKKVRIFDKKMTVGPCIPPKKFLSNRRWMSTFPFENLDRFGRPWSLASPFLNSDRFDRLWIPVFPFKNSDQIGHPWIPASLFEIRTKSTVRWPLYYPTKTSPNRRSVDPYF